MDRTRVVDEAPVHATARPRWSRAALGAVVGTYVAVVLLAARDLPGVLPAGTLVERAALATVRLVAAPMTLPDLGDVPFLVGGLLCGALALGARR